MAKCFVIQPFDNDKFDKRFKDIYKVAIEKCGLEAYRVDKDPKSQVPIDDIIIQIQDSDICLAEITEDNPNVWFELGLAIAYGKQVIMICSDERKGPFPFDVQHRSIARYKIGSKSDFDDLEEKIKTKIKALMQMQQNKHPDMPAPKAKIKDGLESHEVKVLETIATSIDMPGLGALIHKLSERFKAHGLTDMGITLGLNKLTSIDFIKIECDVDENNHEYYVYAVTSKGMNWLMDNKDMFVLENSDKSTRENIISKRTDDFSRNISVDDIPF
jgi:nucleoside 2-deoxyribosyltransferase